MSDRDTIARTLGPFDQHEARTVHNLVPRERVELAWVIETVEIKMMHNRTGRGVLVHEGEGGTRHLIGYTVSGADRLNEGRLPRPELARNRNEQRRMCRASEAPAPVAELLLSPGQRAILGARS